MAVYTTKEQFLTDTVKLSKQLNNIKVSSLRLAIAQKEGFKNVKSFMNHLNNIDLESRLLGESDTFLYMTNRCGESCFESVADFKRIFDIFELDSSTWSEGENGFYPLVDREMNYINDGEVSATTPFGSIPLYYFYTVLINKKKYFTLEYSSYFGGLSGYTEEDALDNYRFMRKPFLEVAKKYDGYLNWDEQEKEFYDDNEGAINMLLCLPMEKIMNMFSDHKDWTKAVAKDIENFIYQPTY